MTEILEELKKILEEYRESEWDSWEDAKDWLAYQIERVIEDFK